jgi:hypothetical protein
MHELAQRLAGSGDFFPLPLVLLRSLLRRFGQAISDLLCAWFASFSVL